jgi:hypothetical protein
MTEVAAGAEPERARGLTAGELRLAAALDARRILRRVPGTDLDGHT